MGTQFITFWAWVEGGKVVELISQQTKVSLFPSNQNKLYSSDTVLNIYFSLTQLPILIHLVLTLFR